MSAGTVYLVGCLVQALGMMVYWGLYDRIDWGDVVDIMGYGFQIVIAAFAWPLAMPYAVAYVVGQQLRRRRSR